MAHTFTYTATTLPWYQVRLTLTSDVSTGATTVTNGGYIESLSDVSESVDLVTGDAKLKSLSFTAVNIDNVFSTHIFTTSTTSVVAILDVSYDAGTTWENLFCGLASLDGLTYRDYDATETRNRSYDVECRSFLADLERVEPFLNPATLGGKITDSRSTIPTYATRPDGSPIESPPSAIGSAPADFYPLTAFFEYYLALAFTDFTPSTIAVDATALEHEATNINTGLDYGFDDWHMLCPTALGIFAPWHFAGSVRSGGYAGAIGTASNARDAVKWMCQGLGCVPVETYSAASGGSYTMKLYPRVPTTADAVTGPMPLLLSRQYRTAPSVTSVNVTTPDLPIKTESLGAGARPYNPKGLLTTSPQWSAGLDYFTWQGSGQGVYRADASSKMVQCIGSTNQLFVKAGATTFRAAHKARIVPSQSYFGASAGYYGVQLALHGYLMNTVGPDAGYRPGFELTYAGIRGATIGDIRPMKTITLGADTYIIESVSRNVMTNEMKLTVALL